MQAKKTTGQNANQAKVIEAMEELLRNPETPACLWEKVSEFVTEQSNECDDSLYQSNFYLTEVMKSVLPEERRGAVLALREAGEGGAHATN